jgi:hypothetical protein
MGITRRKLLGQCSMWAALAAMPAGLSVSANAGTKAAYPVSKDLFTSLEGSTFEVTSGSTHQTLTLVSVDDIPAPIPPDPARFDVQPPRGAQAVSTTAFSLRFYGGTRNLKQGTYKFQNSATGSFNLFIVPGTNPQFYIAIFNRL